MAFLSGLFDSFTGAPAKQAAEKNRQLYSQLRTDGLGFLDMAFGQGSDAINKGIGVYQPLQAKYGAATGLGLDALGVNGPQGNERATGAFQAGPGYNFALNQGLDQLDRRAASRGMLNSGNTNLDTINYSQGLANQEYGGWLDRLLGQSGNEMQAAGGVASGYSGLANLASQTGQGKVGVANAATTGIADQNTAEAQAKAQANKNLWDFGLNVAALGTGQFGRMAGGAGRGVNQGVAGGGYVGTDGQIYPGPGSYGGNIPKFLFS